MRHRGAVHLMRPWSRLLGARSAVQHPGTEIATLALRAAALLRGGVTPARVCVVLAAEAPHDVHLARLAEAAVSGDPAAAMREINRPEWRVFAVVWQLAAESGAAFAAALDRFASSMQALDALATRRSVLLAGSRATVRLVVALPPVALLMGATLGFDPLRVLLSFGGFGLLTGGGLLLTTGLIWSRALRRAVEQRDRVAGLECELVAIALGGGCSPQSACRRVVDAIDQCGAEWVPFDRFVRASAVQETLRLAESTGVPPARLLVQRAEFERVHALAELERDAERLGIRTLLPLAACVLPAFILLGVAPVVVSMLGGW